MQRNVTGVIAVLLLLLLGACQSSGGTSSPPTNTAESVFLGGCDKAEGPLRLYMWYEEVVPEVLEQFEARYGVELSYETYSSNEEMLETLRDGETTYDMVFPSDYAVQIMIEQGMAEKLNKNNIPNRANLTTVLAYYYDPSNEYSMPFQWGTTGIAYNSKYVDPPPDSWAVLFDPAIAGPYAGKFTMLNEERESIGAALIYLGYSVNDTNPSHLGEAQTLLEAQKLLLAGYDSENFSDALVSEEIYLAHAWSGPAALAASQNDDIRYVIPKEGAVIWMDNMVIPTGAAHKCTAELFMNYMLEAEVAAQVSSRTFYNSPVPSSEPLFAAGTRDVLSKGFAINNETINRLEWIEYLGDVGFYTEVWEEITSP
ncbi:MAG: spermidine/putrescine ABC transporter substrate-binding protein [Ardenticatenales bacterium]|nr:spermidine/putrescine ABC transporter substrate-binding protein [Ardenticatenales bacterium]